MKVSTSHFYQPDKNMRKGYINQFFNLIKCVNRIESRFSNLMKSVKGSASQFFNLIMCVKGSEPDKVCER